MGKAQESSDLKSSHPLGLKGLCSVYGLTSLLKEGFFLGSCLFGVGISVVSWLLGNSLRDAIGLAVDIFLSVIPGILGVTLAGYALIVGFGNPDFVRKASRPQSGKKFSFQQRTNAVFGMSIIVQTIELSGVIVVKLAFPIAGMMPIAAQYADLINGIILSVVIGLGLYSLLLIIDTVKSIFNYGQTVHLLFRLEERNPKPKDKQSEE